MNNLRLGQAVALGRNPCLLVGGGIKVTFAMVELLVSRFFALNIRIRNISVILTFG